MQIYNLLFIQLLKFILKLLSFFCLSIILKYQIDTQFKIYKLKLVPYYQKTKFYTKKNKKFEYFC
jgi:hypothetical protein